MKIIFLVAVLGGSLTLASCLPSTPAKQIELSEEVTYHFFSMNNNTQKLETRRIKVSKNAVYDSQIREFNELRYVLPTFSKDGLQKELSPSELAQLRPVDFQKTSITVTPLEFQDDLTTTISFQPINIEGKKIAESIIPNLNPTDNTTTSHLPSLQKKWRKSKNLFPKGAECYHITQITNDQDYIEYSIKDLNKSLKLDSHENVIGFKPQKFGDYEFYLPDGQNLNESEPTAVILKMGTRFFNAKFHPKFTRFTSQINSTNTIEPKGYQLFTQFGLDEVEDQCHFFNDIAANSINLILTEHHKK